MSKPRPMLPEELEYRDTGCDLSPSCLRCPLPQCRYDQEEPDAVVRARSRAEYAARLRAEGYSIDAIKREIGVAGRTVHKLLRRQAS